MGSDWKLLQIGKAIKFNPSVPIVKGGIVKKIPMGMLTEHQRKINGFEYSEYKSGPKFQNGDTLFAKITPCLENGKTAFVDILEEGESAFGSSEFIVLRGTDFTDSEYIYYLSISPTFRKRAISCMEGTSGRKRVNENTLKYFELPFPELSYQKQIAKVFSDIDAKIELNNKINDNLEQLAKTIYDYWFVQFDFPDKNGKPYKSSGGKMVFNNKLKWEIPDGWRNGTIGEIADLVRGVSYKKQNIKSKVDSGVIPILRATNITGNKIDLDNMVYIPEKFVDKSQLLNLNDIVITMSSGSKDHIGKNGMFYFNDEIAFGAFCAKLVAKNKFKYYLFSYTQSEFMSSTIKNECLGTNINNLNSSIVKGFKLVIPNERVIVRFNQKLSSIYSEIANNQVQNQHLTKLRDWLLPMLMNGQVTVG